MAKIDDLLRARGLPPLGAPEAPTSPAPVQPPPSSAPPVAGGGPAVETQAAYGGDWFFQRSPVVGGDYTKRLEAEQNRLVDEQVAREGRPQTEEAWSKVFLDTYAAAKANVGDVAPGEVDTDPKGQGAKLRFLLENDPAAIPGYDVTTGERTAWGTTLRPLAQRVSEATGLPNVLEPAAAAFGTAISAPLLAYGRGVQESLYLPSEKNPDGTDRLYDEGPLTYNEGTDSWHIEHGSRLGASTFLGTAVAAGLERNPELRPGEAPAIGPDPALFSYVAAALAGWGTPEQTYLLERGHDIFTLRKELDLGRLAAGAFVGQKAAAEFAEGVEARTGVPLPGTELQKAFSEGENMAGALAISLVDADITMGLAVGARALKEGVRAGYGSIKSAPYVSEVAQALQEGVGYTTWNLGVNTAWGRASTSVDHARALDEGAVNLEAVELAAKGADDNRPFDLMAGWRKVVDALPRGVKQTVDAQVRVLIATALEPEDAVRKAASKAREAATNLKAFAERELAAEMEEVQALAEFKTKQKAARAAVRADQRAGVVPDMEEVAKASAAGAKLSDETLQAAANISANQAVGQAVKLQKRAVAFTAARTAHAATVALTRNLARNLRAVERMAQLPVKRASDETLAASKALVGDAWDLLNATKDALAKGKADEADLQLAAEAYWRTVGKATEAVGARATAFLQEQLKLAEDAEALARADYDKAHKRSTSTLEKAKGAEEFGKSFKRVAQLHEKHVKANARAFTDADADALVIEATKQVFGTLRRGYSDSLTGQRTVASEVALQSLMIAHAMTHLGRGGPVKAAMRVIDTLQEYFTGDAIARRWFGGTSKLTINAGKEAINSINMVMGDLVGLVQQHGADAGVQMIRYLDSTTGLLKGRVSYNNADVGSTPWEEARSVLRALTLHNNPPGKTYDGVRAMFFSPGEPIEPSILGQLDGALSNLLNTGNYKVSREALLAKLAKADEAAAAAEKAVARAEVAEAADLNDADALAAAVKARGRLDKAIHDVVELKAVQAEAAGMSLETFLLRWFEASVAIQRGGDEMAAWVRYRPTQVEHAEAWFHALEEAGVSVDGFRAALAERDMLGDGTKGMSEFFETLTQAERNNWLYKASKLLFSDDEVKALLEGLDDVPRWQRPKREAFSELLTDEAAQEAIEGAIEVNKALGVKAMLTRSVARGVAAIAEASIVNRVGQSLTQAAFAEARKTPGLEYHTDEQVLVALEAFSRGAFSEAGAGAAEMAAVANALGMTAVEQTIRDVGQDLQAGVEVLRDPANKFRAFVPRAMMRSIDAKLGQIVNSGEMFTTRNTAPTHVAFRDTIDYWARLTQASLLMGVWSPTSQIGYQTVQSWGNFTQLWSTPEAGFGAAGHVLKEELGLVLQMGEQAAEAVRKKMAAKLGIGEDWVLPSLSKSVMDPTVAKIYDPDVSGDTVVEAARGITVRQLRSAVLKHNIASDVVSASGLTNALHRTRSWQALEAQGKTLLERVRGAPRALAEGKVNEAVDAATGAQREMLADFAQAVEQRRRTTLFVHLMMNKGYEPEAASKVVQDAQYDWTHPMTSFESEWLVNWLMFYSYTRRAYEQAMRIAVSPFTTDTESFADAALRGNPMMARLGGRAPLALGLLGEQAKVIRAAKEQAREGEDDSDVYAWWTNKSTQYFMLTNQPMPPGWAQFEQSRGIDNTHMAFSVPNSAPLGTVNHILRLAQMSTAWLVMADDRPGAAELAREMTNFGGFIREDAMNGVVDAVFGPSVPDFKGDYVAVKNPADVAFFLGLEALITGGGQLKKLGVGAGGLRLSDDPATWNLPDTSFLKADRKNGGYVVPRWMAFAKEVVPVFGVEWNRTMEPAIRAYYGTDFKRAESVIANMGYFVGATLRIGKPVLYNPETTHDKDIKYAKLDEKQAKKEEKRYVVPSVADRWRAFYGQKGEGEPKATSDQGIDPEMRERLKRLAAKKKAPPVK